MPALLKKYCCLGFVLLWNMTQAFGFTLLGSPLAPWQTPRLGYDLNAPFFGGPVNLGEEYRWNVPVVYYGFSSEFLNYFGQRGVDDVEKAIKFLNDLPPMSQLNPDDYPLASQRVNHRAQALGLYDLKSYTLSVMLNQMGICDPTRFVFTLRNRFTFPTSTNYHVIKRNFDPITWQHSSFINGQLWTYNIIFDGPVNSLAFTQPVDPLALLGFINAPVTSAIGNDLLLVGGFWTGLTRDDVGGLKYIYDGASIYSRNIENPPPNAFSQFGAVAGGGGSPWGIPPPTVTNGVPGLTNNFISTALRPGIDKVLYQRVNYDSVLGFFEPFTNSWTDTIITNNCQRLTQTLQRPVTVPDIIFDAADLQGPDVPPIWDNFVIAQETFLVWANNSAINGVNDTGGTRSDLGPGVIQPGGNGAGTTPAAFILTFNSVGPLYDNQFPGFLSEANAGRHILWGSFDGSTNEPVVYPVGTSIRQIEAQALSR